MLRPSQAERLRRRLPAYLAGQLSPRQHRRLAAALARDPELAAERDDLLRLHAWLQAGDPAGAPPPDAWRRRLPELHGALAATVAVPVPTPWRLPGALRPLAALLLFAAGLATGALSFPRTQVVEQVVERPVEVVRRVEVPVAVPVEKVVEVPVETVVTQVRTQVRTVYRDRVVYRDRPARASSPRPAAPAPADSEVTAGTAEPAPRLAAQPSPPPAPAVAADTTRPPALSGRLERVVLVDPPAQPAAAVTAVAARPHTLEF